MDRDSLCEVTVYINATSKSHKALSNAHRFGLTDDSGFLFVIKRSITEFFRSSGILFLQKDSRQQGLIKNHFTTEVLKIIYKAAKSEITSDKISFDQNLIFSIKEAIDKFEEEEEELDFSINLLSLCKTDDQYKARAIKAIVYLFPELISVKNRAISEAHLSAGFVHPAIRSLFSGPNDISHCSNTPQYDYFDFANFVDCDTQRINLLYTDVMKKALQNAIGENKLTIAKAINIFNERSKQASLFGKEYNEYWKDRDEK